jgi:hypothetical protein
MQGQLSSQEQQGEENIPLTYPLFLSQKEFFILPILMSY